MRDLKTEIEKILAKYDPARLICIRAPQDEYRQEATEIAERLSRTYSIKDITKLMEDVFHQNFDIAYAISEKSDELVWIKHAIGKVKFPSHPAASAMQALTFKREVEPNPERLIQLRRAAQDIHELLVGPDEF